MDNENQNAKLNKQANISGACDRMPKCRVAAYSCVLIAGLVLLDQFVKQLAVRYLKGNMVWLIKDVFSLRYLENQGVGFSLFEGKTGLILLFNLLVLAAILVFLWILPIARRMTPIRIALLFTVSGAIGNIIDRVRLGYVVDFLSFDLISFPVFNIADIYVTLSVIALAVLYLFYLRPNELENALHKKTTQTGIKESDISSDAADEGK